ncbi:DUF4118 domain-containing protein [Xinfangfangia sp. D13-10-4-6]|uniref:sensor histidine kinase n=1 Tax=Pseudogemmobacter hezensis TaxID=2737662 RepID=UPI00155704D8|nr:DUF4118 domain-containing protein [Pseudogemmobacter hezensis]NPD16083.1 DUF4118 domain-containing protein [Pseudogemmobacter hezensis]
MDPAFPPPSGPVRAGPLSQRPLQLLVAVLVLALVTLILVSSRGWMSEIVALLVLLMAVLINAAAFGFWPGIGSAVAAVAVFNFFFIEPQFTLMAARPQDMIVLVAFLAAAGLTGFLAGRMREQVDTARDRALVLTVLSSASSALNAAQSETQVLAAATRHIAALSDAPVAVLTRLGEVLQPQPGGPDLRPADYQAAGQALLRGRREDGIAEGWTGSHLTFHPLPLGEEARYAIGHRLPNATDRDAGYRGEAIDSVLRQAGATLERLELARKAGEERETSERQMLRAALLSSLSHDLRTPLATILGSVTTLRDLREGLTPEAQSDLIDAASEEAERLARYVEKLLQMTRLVSGAAVAFSPVAPADCARAAAARARRAWPACQIRTDLPDLALVMAEAGLVEQVVFSLIENAQRYAPGPITVTGSQMGDQIRLEVHDSGAGLPAPVAAWLATPDLTRGEENSGLGLPICKGIARLLGGRLEAHMNPSPGGGSQIALVLPIAPALSTAPDSRR